MTGAMEDSLAPHVRTLVVLRNLPSNWLKNVDVMNSKSVFIMSKPSYVPPLPAFHGVRPGELSGALLEVGGQGHHRGVAMKGQILMG